MATWSKTDHSARKRRSHAGQDHSSPSYSTFGITTGSPPERPGTLTRPLRLGVGAVIPAVIAPLTASAGFRTPSAWVPVGEFTAARFAAIRTHTIRVSSA